MDSKLKDFIIENKELIQQNKIENLYARLWTIGVSPKELTEFFLKADVNPLDYFKEKIPTGCFIGLDIGPDISIPDGIKKIGYSSFERCSNLKSVFIPDSVESIEERAFNDCYNLKSLEFSPHSSFPNLEIYVTALPPNLNKLVLPDDCSLIFSSGKIESKKTLSHLDYPIIYKKIKYDNGKSLGNFLYPDKPKTNKIFYRIDDAFTSLIAYNSPKLNNEARTTFKKKEGMQARDCPVFFESEEEAKEFLDNYNRKSSNPINYRCIHVAKLSYRDTSFTKIKTDVGEALIQGWKDSYVTPFIIKKDYIKL